MWLGVKLVAWVVVTLCPDPGMAFEAPGSCAAGHQEADPLANVRVCRQAVGTSAGRIVAKTSVSNSPAMTALRCS